MERCTKYVKRLAWKLSRENRAGRLIVAGAGLGLVGWLVYRGAQGAAAHMPTYRPA